MTDVRTALAAALDDVSVEALVTIDQVWQLVDGVLEGLAARGLMIVEADDMLAAARWIVDQLGYPFDQRADVPAPEPLRRAIVAAWIARDGDGNLETAAFIERTCAEEGGW